MYLNQHRFGNLPHIFLFLWRFCSERDMVATSAAGREVPRLVSGGKLIIHEALYRYHSMNIFRY